MDNIGKLIENVLQMYRQNSAGRPPSKLTGRLSSLRREELLSCLRTIYADRASSLQSTFVDDDFIEDKMKRLVTWLCSSERPGLLFYGRVGTGKTTMLESLKILLRCDTPSRSVASVSATQITLDYKLGMANSGLCGLGTYDHARNAGILLLDDLGCEPSARSFGVDYQPICDLICYRYAYQMPTIITTNLGDEQLRAEYGERVWDRIVGSYDTIVFDRESYRRRREKQEETNDNNES